jgi:hypothetical protein
VKSTTDTDAVRRLVEEAAEDKFGDGAAERADIFFEHGQWWIVLDEDEVHTYSVVDAVPGISHGLDFEEI